MSPTPEELAEAVTRFVNSTTVKEQSFIACMNTSHRTLQQSFTRLCLKWIEHCAGNGYRTDGRNEASHNICKKIVVGFKVEHGSDAPSNYLPFI